MFKNTLKRLGAIVMVLAMAMSVMAISAFAVDDVVGVGIDSITIKKTVKTDGKTYAPVTDFTFTINTAGATTYDGNTVYEGKTDGAYFATGKDTISFAAADGYTNLLKSTDISTDITKFSAPGVYHYTVTETAGTYEGISYDTDARDLYVYVTYKKDADGNQTNELVVSNVALVNNGTKSDSWENTYTTNKLTITKKLSGDQAYPDDSFTFTVTINGTSGEQYLVTDLDGNVVTTLTSGTSNSTDITLKGDQSVIVWGLSKTDNFTVVENANEKGYTASYTLNGNATNAVSGVAANEQDNTVVVTNTKNANTPTGVIMNIAPYVLMVALAGGIAFFFLRRRHAE